MSESNHPLSLNELKRRLLLARILKLFASTVATAALIILLYVAFDFWGSRFGLTSVAGIVSFALVLLSIAFGLLQYLQSGQRDDVKPIASVPSASSHIAALARDVQMLTNRLNSIEAPWTTADREALRDHVRELLTSEVALEDLQAKVQDLAGDLSKRTVTDVLDAQLNATLQRISSAIPKTMRRANLNLVIGILTTIVGITFLGLGVIEATNEVKELEDPTLFAARFLPRLSLAALIEVFAYFFLRLYKADLDGVRYMQNEMTNVEMVRSAFVTSIMLNEKQTSNAIALKLAGTDRNAVAAAANASPVSTKEITAAIELLRAASGVKFGKEK